MCDTGQQEIMKIEFGKINKTLTETMKAKFKEINKTLNKS